MTPEELLAFGGDNAQAPAAATPPAAVAEKPKGWWRRNIVALIALGPLFAIAIAVAMIDPYYRFWESEPLVPVGVRGPSWSTVDGVELRLVELTETAPKDSSGKIVALPAGTLAWKAVVEFKVADPEAAKGCTYFLEDNQGRLYSAGPTELVRAKDSGGFPACADDETKSASYRIPTYFVLPKDAKPVAVRVTWRSRYPEFARLPLP